MKKIISVLVMLSIVSGCATTPSQKQQNAQQIQAIKKVQVTYEDDTEYVVLDKGSKSYYFGALLGPIGMLAAAAVDIGTAATAKNRMKTRSAEFTSQVVADLPERQQVKQKIADDLDKVLKAHNYQTLQVKTPVLIKGEKDEKEPDFDSGVTTKDGYSLLLMRMKQGYKAESTTARYRPYYSLVYMLKDADKVLLTGAVEAEGEKAYRTFAELQEDRKNAYEKLLKLSDTAGQQVYNQIFVFSDK